MVCIPQASMCRCRESPRDCEQYCMKCGEPNPNFTMKAYRREHPHTSFGADCRNQHFGLLEAMKDFPESPYCADCGWQAEVSKPQTP